LGGTFLPVGTLPYLIEYGNSDRQAATQLMADPLTPQDFQNQKAHLPQRSHMTKRSEQWRETYSDWHRTKNAIDVAGKVFSSISTRQGYSGGPGDFYGPYVPGDFPFLAKGFNPNVKLDPSMVNFVGPLYDNISPSALPMIQARLKEQYAAAWWRGMVGKPGNPNGPTGSAMRRQRARTGLSAFNPVSRGGRHGKVRSNAR
jgi:hypothetical protein